MKLGKLKSARARVLAAATVIGMAAMSSAHAAIDVSADITAAKADVTSNGTAVLGVVVAVAVIAWIRRVLR